MRLFCLSLVATACVGLVGCNARKPDGGKNASTSGDTHGHEHSEDAHGHGHDGEGHGHSDSGHTHGAGPHGGTVADWGGGKYHVEFTVDHDKQQATVFVFGADEKTPAPIASESIELSIHEPQIQVLLTALPQEVTLRENLRGM